MKLPKLNHSLIKIGASNLLNYYHVDAIGDARMGDCTHQLWIQCTLTEDAAPQNRDRPVERRADFVRQAFSARLIR